MKIEKMTKETLVTILTIVDNLREIPERRKTNKGICFNLSWYYRSNQGLYSDDFILLVSELSLDWPQVSSKAQCGSNLYPIDRFVPNYLRGTLWQGEQLELRESLLDHLSFKLNKIISARKREQPKCQDLSKL